MKKTHETVRRSFVFYVVFVNCVVYVGMGTMET